MGSTEFAEGPFRNTPLGMQTHPSTSGILGTMKFQP